MERAIRNCIKKKPLLAAFLGECMGVFVLCALGNASVAQNHMINGAFLDINFAYGFACAFGVYVSCAASGGHINPAVTITEVILGRMSFVTALVYICGQMLGGFLSGIPVFLVYGQFLDLLGDETAAGVYATYPTQYGSEKPTTGTLFADQLFGTMFLVFIVSSITDQRNSKPHSGFVPLLVGFVVMAIGMCFGSNCGYAINPARDLGPRLFSAILYGSYVFTAADYFFWIPIVAPIVGAFLGGFLYLVLISAHLPDIEEERRASNNRISIAETAVDEPQTQNDF